MDNEAKAMKLSMDFRALCLKNMELFTALEFSAMLLTLTSKLMFDAADDEELARELINVCVEGGWKAHEQCAELDKSNMMNKVLIKLFDELVEGE